MPTIAILGTMDTKGDEHAYVAELIRQRGHQVLVIDVGTLGEPRLQTSSEPKSRRRRAWTLSR